MDLDGLLELKSLFRCGRIDGYPDLNSFKVQSIAVEDQEDMCVQELIDTESC